MQQHNPTLFAAITAPQPEPDVRTLYPLIPAKTLLIQYTYLDETLLIWGISQDGMQHSVVQTIDERRLNYYFEQLLAELSRGQTATRFIQEISHLLVEPFDHLLGTYTHLIIVPYGKGNTIPFSVLTWRKQPLIETHTITYLPSIIALQYLQRIQIDQDDSALVVGNPTKMQWRQEPLKPLHFAEQEARTIAQFGPSTLLLSNEATVDAVVKQLSNHTIFHVATHGIIDARYPLLSGIALANGEMLHILNLLAMRVNLKLVVLSACETGRGETTKSNDLISLAQGFLAAGVQTVVMTQWAINDASTQALMEVFYTHLHAGASVASALRLAQLALGHYVPKPTQPAMPHLDPGNRMGSLDTDDAPTLSNAAPYHWAPFIVVGLP